VVRPASSTPGSSLTERSASSQKRSISGGSAYAASGSEMRAVSTRRGSKPGSTRWRFTKEWRRRPAPSSSGSASANSPATSAPWKSCVPRPAPARWPPPRMEEAMERDIPASSG
jgi:hypothetical protein